LTVQPPDLHALDNAIYNLQEVGGIDRWGELTIIGEMLVKLPLELKLCRLVAYSVAFGYVADGIVLAASLA